MEITTHGLKKPSNEDFYNIQDHNENTDIVEGHLSDAESHVNVEFIVDSTEAEILEQINNTDTPSKVWGKIKKAISSLIAHIAVVASSTISGHIKIGTGLKMDSGVASVKLTDDIATDDSTIALSSSAGKNINDKVENVKDKIRYDANDIIMIGDSYANSTTQSPNWTDFLSDLINTDGDVYKNGVNGACFTGGASGALMKFQTMLTNIGSSIVDKSKVKSIIVAGGFNDRGVSTSSILTAISDFAVYAKANYPKADLYLAMIGHTRDVTTTDLTVPGGYIFNLRTVLPAYSRANEYGFNFLVGCEQVMHKKSYFQSDLIHPNEEGSKEIARSMFNAINGFSSHFSDFGEPFTISAAGISTAVGDTNIYNYQEGEHIYMQISGTFATTSTNLVSGTEYKIGNINNSYGSGDPYFSPRFNCALQTNVGIIDAVVVLKNGINIIPLENKTGVIEIKIPPFLAILNCNKF